MTVTYNADLSDDISNVRFFVGDTVVNAGPRPNVANVEEGSNFQDSELTAILEQVSGNVKQAIATIFNVLYAEWSKYATSITIGPRKEELFRISARYKEQADEWLGTSGLSSRTFSSGVKRATHADSGHVI